MIEFCNFIFSNDSGAQQDSVPQAAPSKNPSNGTGNSQNGQQNSQNGGKRTESPDIDSAFCDNLSILSSCSTSSR